MMRTLYDALFPAGVDDTPAISAAAIVALLTDVATGWYTREEAVRRSALRDGAARQLKILIDDLTAATDKPLFIMEVQSALTWAERRLPPGGGNQVPPRTPQEFQKRLKLA